MVIIRLFHDVIDLIVRESFVASDINMIHFGFLALIHIHRHLYIARVVLVLELQHLYIRSVESFFLEIFTNHFLRTISKVRSHLSTFLNTYFYLNIFLLCFAQTIIRDL